MTMDWETAFEGPLSEYVPSRGQEHVRIPWPEIEAADPDLGQLVLSDPESGIEQAEHALKELSSRVTDLRIYDLPERRTFRVGKYGSEKLGTLIGVHGRVVSVDGVKPFAKRAAFECHRCGTLNYVRQPGGRLLKPGQCKECEASKSQLLLNITQSTVVDFQKVVLKRPNSSMDDPPIETVFLWDGLCETVSTGDVVTIVGTYDTLPWPDEAVLKTYLDAVSINKSEQPATVDEIADWRVKKWTFEAADELCQAGSNYDCSKREVVETVSDEHGVAEGEITAALSDLDDQSVVSERRNGRIHITTSSPPTFEPDE